MARECHHIMPSGERCRAYALSGATLCYFHSNLSRMDKARLSCRPLNFASLEDMHGIQMAIRQVFNMIDDPYADTRRTGQLLYALQLAAQVSARTSKQHLAPSKCPHCSGPIGLPAEAYELEPGSPLDWLPTETKSHPISDPVDPPALRIREAGVESSPSSAQLGRGE